MDREIAVSIRGVSRSFGDNVAVRDLNLEIERGSIHGLLGPNGSGKSTTMKMVMGLLKPDSGVIDVYGKDPQRDPIDVKSMVGYVPETSRLYEYLTGLEYLDFIADVYGVDPEAKEERIYEFLDAFSLDGRENEMISGYSHGMKQKTALIGALLHRPRLLILDEPLGGLDPKSARIVKDILLRLSREGVTTIFSTHIMEIADALCDRVSVLYQGEKLGEGSPAELRERAGRPGSTLEEVFLMLTGADDVAEIVDALMG
jgi:ABC-2 type transport system ATP-binding protein